MRDFDPRVALLEAREAFGGDLLAVFQADGGDVGAISCEMLECSVRDISAPLDLNGRDVVAALCQMLQAVVRDFGAPR